MINVEDAIKAINPLAEFSCTPADSVSNITWLNGTTPISNEDILAKQAELQVLNNMLEIEKKNIQLGKTNSITFIIMV